MCKLCGGLFLYNVLFEARHLTKSWIAERSVEARQVARVAELEELNAQLCMELDAVRPKLVEVERRG
jgi:hypothetical protein